MDLCACSIRLLDTNHASYVVAGVPCCSRECWQRAERKLEERRPILERFVKEYADQLELPL